ncbi:hypothetical protein, conserved [Trypanosoma brucei brucei TREU927]|uniref:Uncharacterized protein n=1 Tax=Trypanosoma brucei brucei (strain 927/4 GUTat10.1) TaxID=185431 RepID=Q385C5_TRYB2|nr:hypothetical protein, conserved [Trypanosoma brucei brucei TREU927]EAN79606.1 hypothetical protein, conserved [Trypanosoma brucei brucei TREU927]
MPPKNNPKQHANVNGNHKLDSRPSNETGRPKREENKADDVVVPAGPTIKAQITNASKTSSGKTFLEALRTNVTKQTVRVEKPRTPEPPEVAVPEPEVPVAEEPTVEAVVAPVEIPPTPVEESPVVEKQPTPTPKPQQPPKPQPTVTLPESNGNFSWANDDDYTFSSDITPQHPVVPPQAKPVTYIVTYPAEVVEAHSKGPRVVFEAPASHQRIDSAMAELEKGRANLYNERHLFEECRKQREIEMNEKHARLLAQERQLNDQSDGLQRERSRLVEQQQQLQQQQQQQQQQQMIQQQPAPLRQAPSSLPVTSQTQLPPPPQPPQHVGNNYTYQTGTQDGMPWGGRGRNDHWTPNAGVMVPPYDHNHYYSGGHYLMQRNQNFGDRGVDVPPHMGRGNAMRGGPHMGGFSAGRPMGGADGGVNQMFGQRNSGGYMGGPALPNRW